MFRFKLELVFDIFIISQLIKEFFNIFYIIKHILINSLKTF